MPENKKTYTIQSLAPLTLILVSFFWGATFPWVKEALNNFSPLYWVAFRFLLAAFLFGLIYLFKSGDKIKGVKQGIILGSVLGSAFIMQTIGIKLSSAATMGLLTGLILPFIYVLETVIGKRKLQNKVKMSLFLAFVGFLLLSWERGIKFHTADFLGVIASFLFALQIFLTGKFAPKFRIATLNFYQMTVISVMGFICAFAFEDFSKLNFTSGVAVSSIIFTAIFCSFFAFFIQTWAQRHVSSAKTTLYFSLEPLFAAILSWAIYYNEITSYKIMGAILMICAVAAVQKWKTLKTLARSEV